METVTHIIKLHLQQVGADGLVAPDIECGCHASDLAPCGEFFGDCQAGWASSLPDDARGLLIWSSKELADADRAAHQATKEPK